jgi:cytochrome oxidase assembly protein ShyY1
MNGFQVLLVVIAVDASVLGIAVLAIWQLNRAVGRNGG